MTLINLIETQFWLLVGMFIYSLFWALCSKKYDVIKRNTDRVIFLLMPCSAALLLLILKNYSTYWMYLCFMSLALSVNALSFQNLKMNNLKMSMRVQQERIKLLEKDSDELAEIKKTANRFHNE